MHFILLIRDAISVPQNGPVRSAARLPKAAPGSTRRARSSRRPLSRSDCQKSDGGFPGRSRAVSRAREVRREGKNAGPGNRPGPEAPRQAGKNCRRSVVFLYGRQVTRAGRPCCTQYCAAPAAGGFRKEIEGLRTRRGSPPPPVGRGRVCSFAGAKRRLPPFRPPVLTRIGRPIKVVEDSRIPRRGTNARRSGWAGIHLPVRSGRGRVQGRIVIRRGESRRCFVAAALRVRKEIPLGLRGESRFLP